MPKRKTEVIESFGERLAQLRKAAGFTQVEDSPLANSRLFRRFKMLERLNQDDQDTVIKIIDAIIAKGRVEAALAPVDAAA